MSKKTGKGTKKGEQGEFLNVRPKNVQEIIEEARVYVKYRDARMAQGKKESEHKCRVIELVKAADLQPLKGGKVKFEHDGIEISLTPEEMKLKVKDTTKDADD